MFTLIGKTNIDFLRWRYPAFALSLAMSLAGIWGAFMLLSGRAPMATDLGGGSKVEVKLEKMVQVDEVRAALKAQGIEGEIQQVQGTSVYVVRLRQQGPDVGQAGTSVAAALGKGLQGNKVVDSSTEEVGPSVSRDLRSKSLSASLIVALAVLIYVMIRFDLRFAVGALLATAHDILTVLGVMVFLGHDFSMLVVTGLLTLAGYSLNDTVVVFDRIRENLKARRSDSYVKVVNDSINETLTRTVVTGLTTLFVLTVLYSMGGEVTKDFCLTLLIGIVVGTYSSIFVASPVVVEWHLRSPQKN